MKRLMAVSAAAALLTGTLLTAAEAAPVALAKVSMSSIELIAAKATSAAKGPGKCGPNMFWSTKNRKCEDARTKK